MRRLVTASFLVAVSSLALAQMQDTMGGAVQRSSSPRGVQIKGETAIGASAQNVSSVAAGEGNTAKTATGAIRGGTQIQGNTRISASTKNVSSVAVGKGNAATNEVGAIGGDK